MNAERLDSLAGGALEILWRSSWQAAALALIVLAVQWSLGGKVSARWRYNLWFLVLLRLLVPVTPQSPLSLFNLSNHLPRGAHAPLDPRLSPHPEPAFAPLVVSNELDRAIPLEAPAVGDGAKPQAAGNGFSGSLQSAEPRATVRWRLMLASVWLTGLLVLLARIAYATFRLSREVRRMKVVDDPRVRALLEESGRIIGIRYTIEVRSSEDMPAPALMGVLRPRLLLPSRVLENFDDAELRLILLHELAHLKRRDVAVNWLASLLCAAHWFNPVLWLAFARLRADRELACDELVLARAGAAARNVYGNTIVKLLQSLGHPPRQRPALVGAVGILERGGGCGGGSLRRRITMIAQFNNAGMKRRTTAIAAACMIALAALGLTDAVRGEDGPAAPATAAAEPIAPAAGPARGSQPATRTSATAPVNAKLRALVDEAAARTLARNAQPTPADIEAAMKELAIHLRTQLLIYDQHGRPANEPQVYDEVRHVQRMLEAKLRPADARVKLARAARELDFDAAPFADVVSYFRDATGLNFFVNWRQLEAAGIDRNATVTLQLRDVPYEQALRYVLRDVGGGTVRLDFAVMDGVVNISTAEALSIEPVVRVYDVAALLQEMSTTQPAGGDAEKIRAAKVEALVTLVTETVAADSWREAGGTVGAIREINDRLVITQTETNHAAIQKLLSEIRRAPATAGKW